MVNENIFELIEELEMNGYHGWSFKFKSRSGEVDLLLNYLEYSDKTHIDIINSLPRAVAYLDSIVAENFDVTYGYKTLKFRLRYNENVVPENVVHIYRQLAHYFNASEKLVYGFGFGWLNHHTTPGPLTLEDVTRLTVGHYLEINYD